MVSVASSDELLRQLRRMQGEVDQLFMEIWAGAPSRHPAAARPPADVYLVGDPPVLTVQLDVAGADPGEIAVQLEGDLLTIKGRRERPAGERRRYHHAEIDWGPFERRLRLNVPVDADGVAALLDRGLLTISLPLARRTPERRVEISVQGVSRG